MESKKHGLPKFVKRLAAKTSVANLLRPAYHSVLGHFSDSFKKEKELKQRALEAKRLAEATARKTVAFEFSEGKLIARMNDGTSFNICLENLSISGFLLLGESYEKHETDFIKKKVRDMETVLDVGANFGWYAIHMAKAISKDGMVLAFEPISSTYKELTSNISLNSCKNVLANELALGNTCGKKTFFVPQFSRGSGAASEIHYYGSKIDVEMTRLDDFMASQKRTNADFVKADIEGGELNFLLGAEKTLEKCAPDLLLEIEPSHTERFDYKPSAIFNLLKNKGYVAFCFDEKGELLDLEDREKDIEYSNMYYFTKRE